MKCQDKGRVHYADANALDKIQSLANPNATQVWVCYGFFGVSTQVELGPSAEREVQPAPRAMSWPPPAKDRITNSRAFLEFC